MSKISIPRLFGLMLATSCLFLGGVYASAADTHKAPKRKPGEVLTFYGLRHLEQDTSVSDEEKLAEWQSFISRAKEQSAYAKKAVVRWKETARIRLVEAARKADRNTELSPKDKISHWEKVSTLYSKTKEAKEAQKRAAFWRQQETKRLVEFADEVERARGPKVERIQSWAKVLDWAKKGREAGAAQKRISDLQAQLYAEAVSVDKISRVDAKTKLRVWKDVLEGKPSAAQKRTAQKRIDELDALVTAGSASASTVR